MTLLNQKPFKTLSEFFFQCSLVLLTFSYEPRANLLQKRFSKSLFFEPITALHQKPLSEISETYLNSKIPLKMGKFHVLYIFGTRCSRLDDCHQFLKFFFLISYVW